MFRDAELQSDQAMTAQRVHTEHGQHVEAASAPSSLPRAGMSKGRCASASVARAHDNLTSSPSSRQQSVPSVGLFGTILVGRSCPLCPLHSSRRMPGIGGIRCLAAPCQV